jgi:hypothetical protein
MKLMKHGSTLFLKSVISGIGIIVLAMCVFWFPHIGNGILREFPGVSFELTPALFGLYGSAIPFFFALYQALKLLSYVDKNKVFSELSVRAVKYIKYSGIAMSIFYAICLPLVYRIADIDDAPGLVVMGMAFTMAPTVVAVFAAVVQNVLESALDIKSENDLTV